MAPPHPAQSRRPSGRLHLRAPPAHRCRGHQATAAPEAPLPFLNPHSHLPRAQHPTYLQHCKVVYTCGPLLRVAVVATKHQQLMERPSHLHAAITNDFTFVLVAVGSHPLRPVEPESLREVVQYLAAHRLHLADEYQAPPLLLREGMEHVLVG